MHNMLAGCARTTTYLYISILVYLTFVNLNKYITFVNLNKYIMGKELEFCVQPRLKDKISVKLKKIIFNVKNR